MIFLNDFILKDTVVFILLLFIKKKIRNLRSSLPIKHIPWISGVDESCLKVLLVLGLDAGPWAA